MINLLPQKEKQDLVFQKKLNLTIVLASITVVFFICLSLVLLSLDFYILQQSSSQDGALDDVKSKYQTAEFSTLLDSLKSYNLVLGKAYGFYKNQTYSTDILRTVFAVDRPEGVTFNNIVIDQKAVDKLVKVSISGLSLTRDDLILLKNSMEDQSNIKNVILPPGSLVKPSNVNFDITFEVDESAVD